MRYVRFEEISEKGDISQITISAENAIVKQKVAAATKNHTYDNDQEALDDFLTVNYAWIVEV